MIAYSDTADGIADAAVAAGIVRASARHAIYRAALGVAADFIAKGVDVSAHTFMVGPDLDDPEGAVQLLYGPPVSRDPAPLRYMLAGLEPESDLYRAIAGETDGRLDL